jgi:cytidylate kinase
MDEPCGAVADVGSRWPSDRSDRMRATSPLMIAPDAIVIDTTAMSIIKTVERVLDIVSR